MQGHTKHADEDDILFKRFKHLEEDWKYYKQTNPRRFRRCSTEVKPKPKRVNTSQLSNASPTNMIPALPQQKSSTSVEEWKVRTNDLAVVEILEERKAAIESGKLKGRRLFQALESADAMGLSGKEEIYSDSTCSNSVLVQGRSLCSYSSSSNDSDGDVDDGRVDDEYAREYIHSSSSLSSSLSVLKEKIVASSPSASGGVGLNDGGKWMGLMGALAVVLLVFALCIISFSSFDGFIDEDTEIIIPT